jgi:hypothetical protein
LSDNFVFKASVNLVGMNGCLFRGDAETGQTDWMWNIVIEKADLPTRLDKAWERQAYRDLDMSDLGADLLIWHGLRYASAGKLEEAGCSVG